MKAYVIFSSREPVLIGTRHTIRNETVLSQLGRVGIRKFISREVPVGHLRRQYGSQFDVIKRALEKGSNFRVLDFSGRRIFQNLPFSDLGPAYRHDDPLKKAEPTRDTPLAPRGPYPVPASPSVFG
jgi:hypothetical protein